MQKKNHKFNQLCAIVLAGSLVFGTSLGPLAQKTNPTKATIHKLTEEQKAIILSKLYNKVTKDGVLQVISQTERNQLGNKEIVIKKFYEMLHKCFVVQKKRRATKPSKGSKERRLSTKKRDSEIKKSRKKDW